MRELILHAEMWMVLYSAIDYFVQNTEYLNGKKKVLMRRLYIEKQREECNTIVPQTSLFAAFELARLDRLCSVCNIGNPATHPHIYKYDPTLFSEFLIASHYVPFQ